MQSNQNKNPRYKIKKWVFIFALLVNSILPAQGMWTAGAYLFNGLVAAATQTTEIMQNYATVPKTPDNTFNMYVANDQKKEAFEVVKQQLMELADSQSLENETIRQEWVNRYCVAERCFFEYEEFKKQYEAVEQRIDAHYISEKVKKEKEKTLETITKCHRIIYFGLQKLHVYEGQGGIIDRSISSKTRRRAREKSLECSKLTEKNTQWATFDISLYRLSGQTDFSNVFNNFLNFFQEKRTFFQKTHPDILETFEKEVDLKVYVYEQLGLNEDGTIKVQTPLGTSKVRRVLGSTPPVKLTPVSSPVIPDLLGLDFQTPTETFVPEIKKAAFLENDYKNESEEYNQGYSEEDTSGTE